MLRDLVLNQFEPPTRRSSAATTNFSSLAKCLAIPAHHGGREEYGLLFR
jgi:hypothetical protein